MLSKTEAIVLHSIKYGEQRLIVDMFTREHGRLSFIVSVPKTNRSKLKKQFFQPLTLLYIEADIRPQAQLQKLRDVSLLVPLGSLLLVPDKLAIGLFVAEFLYYALRDEQQNIPLFDYIRSSLEWLDGRSHHYANFHLVFLMHLSRFLGFYPNLSNQGGQNVYFDLRASSFCEDAPVHPDFLMPQESARIGVMMRMDFPSMHLFRLSRADRNRTLEIIERYYRLHLPAFPELKSLPVLRELFA